MEELKDHQQQGTGSFTHADRACGTHCLPGLQLGGLYVEDLLCSLFSICSYSAKSVPALPGTDVISQVVLVIFSVVGSLQWKAYPSHI